MSRDRFTHPGVLLMVMVLGGLLPTGCGSGTEATEGASRPASSRPPPGGTPDAASAPTDPGASTSMTTAAPTTAAPTTAPPTTTSTVPPPAYSFDGSVPAPELVNTGTDFDAIWRSFEAYLQWLFGHNPDPELADEVFVVGTPLFDRYRDDLALLERSAQRFLEPLTITSIEVDSHVGNVATLTARYVKNVIQIVSSDGTIADEAQVDPDQTWLITLSSDARGRWHIAAARRSTEGTEVQL